MRASSVVPNVKLSVTGYWGFNCQQGAMSPVLSLTTPTCVPSLSFGGAGSYIAVAATTGNLWFGLHNVLFVASGEQCNISIYVPSIYDILRFLCVRVGFLGGNYKYGLNCDASCDVCAQYGTGTVGVCQETLEGMFYTNAPTRI